jgi:hypothetical protein
MVCKTAGSKLQRSSGRRLDDLIIEGLPALKPLAGWPRPEALTAVRPGQVAGQNRSRIVLRMLVWSKSVLDTVRGSAHGDTTRAGTRTQTGRS